MIVLPTRQSARLLHFVAITVVLAFSGCTLAPVFGSPPIRYEEAWVVSGDRGALHHERGLYLGVANASPETIRAAEITVELFTADGGLPEFGPVRLSGRSSLLLAPGESAVLVMNLDAAADDLVPDRIRVSRVEFANGSTWRNPGSLMYEGSLE